MHRLFKRLPLLLLAALLIAAPTAEAFAAHGAPLAGAAKKKGKKKKKCKKGQKRVKVKKGKKRSKCVNGEAGSGSAGLPGKPVNPAPPEPPEEPEPLLIETITLSENPLLAGSSGQGQVTLSRAAPSGGQPVTLGSDDPTRALVPDSIHIAQGQSTGSFQIDTTGGSSTAVTLTAAVVGSVRQTQLDIVMKESLLGLELDYQCYPGSGLTDFGANIVSLDVRAPDNVQVALASGDPFSLTVPPSVTIPQGSFNGVFGVNTLAATPAVTVTASYDGIDVQDTASIRETNSPAPVPADLDLQPASIVVGDSSTGIVELDCEAPPGGITVTLDVDYAGVTIPASVLVPEGELSASFPITTVSSTIPGQTDITATAGASVQATLTLRAIGT
ncbi:MAG: hypothetical protein FJW90_12735 [Actinobacteria bacterium]|nr:hypothetical protein [Actinomycetota bacterium]